MAFFKINGIAVKPPTACTWGLQDLSSEDSGRTRNNGEMHKDIVAQKRALKVKWGAMSWEEASQIVQMCKNKGVTVLLTYSDIMAGGIITKNFYTGDCTVPYKFWTDERKTVENIMCDFIEI